MPKHPKLAQRSDGRYYVRHNGKCFYGKTQSEAYAKRDEYIRQQQEGLYLQKSLTLADYAAKWLPVHKASVSTKCYNDYAKQIDKLVQSIGNKVIKDIKPSDIKRVYSEHFIGMSASTIHRASMLYVSIFNSAVQDGVIRTNPCKAASAQPHKGTVGTHRAITDEQRNLIINTQHRFRLLAMVMLYAGLRRGEALAINIDKDVDFENSCIHVDEAIRYESNQPILDLPKTENSIRQAPLFDILRNALTDQHGLLAVSVKQKSSCTETAFRRGWNSYNHALSVSAGHEIKIRPHDLRHSFCVMCRDAGIDMKLVMKWMGHADEKMILQIYDHITEKRVQSAMENINKSINESQKESQK